jgi:glycerol-3-phosphate dehydrogenase
LSVCLCEKDDLANYTSSYSTKLIHGGLRYLEQYDLKLVQESLRERKILRERAPHLVHPIPFYLPHVSGGRPAWVVRLGLWLYDHLASHGGMPASRSFTLKKEDDNPLNENFTRCFSYSDCQVDDSRLVLVNAQLAQSKGATIKTRCEVISAICENGLWVVQVRNKLKAKIEVIRARALVNATGPWVDVFGKQLLGEGMTQQVRCVQGSHFIVKAFYSGNQAYILKQPDGRIVFAIPYLDRFSLIGTTDKEFSGDLENPEMSDEECDYLLDAMNRFFQIQHSRKDILGSFAGVRPLYDDHKNAATKVSREYHLLCDVIDDKLPIIHVVGGKLTTYRHVAEHVMKQLKSFFPEMSESWTKTAIFPGSNWNKSDEQDSRQDFFSKYNDLDQVILTRLWKTYGMCAYPLLGDAKYKTDLGEEILPGLHLKEIDYLIDYEWVVTANDLLWRRTKLGLDYTPQQHEILENFFRAQHTDTWKRN